MKLAVATTTIHDCRPQIRWLHACDPSVPVFLATDNATPHTIHSSDHVRKIVGTSYKCSPLLGWNTIERRNVAILEALKWGAEAIVLWDDDNLPPANDYFWWFKTTLDREFGGLFLASAAGWFDPGSLLQPPVRHRGFPHQIVSDYEAGVVVNAKVGLAGGIVLGDPDIGAVERIAKAPIVHGFSELLRQGVIVNPNTWTITNSQNTAVLRQFAPCMLTCPQFGRYADIFASLVCQRVMREYGYVVHLGLPAVWQARNKHDLVKDLADEMFGMQHIVDFAEQLDAADLSDRPTVLEQVHYLYARLAQWRHCPTGLFGLADAWLEDVEGVL